jgi:Flp pilus assembly protein TadD
MGNVMSIFQYLKSLFSNDTAASSTDAAPVPKPQPEKIDWEAAAARVAAARGETPEPAPVAVPAPVALPVTEAAPATPLPEDAPTAIALGKKLMGEGNFAGAITLFEQVLRADPDNEEATGRLQVAQVRLAKAGKAG